MLNSIGSTDLTRTPNHALDSTVVVTPSVRPDYGLLSSPEAAPELPGGSISTIAQSAVRRLFHEWGLDITHTGSSQWNPLSDVIVPGARVVIKPNWVHHRNRSDDGLDCLITHPSIIGAVLDYVRLAGTSSVIVGDSPVQGCDFEVLRSACALDDLVERHRRQGMNVSIADFRRTLLTETRLHRREQVRPEADYVLFDLAKDSLLEPITISGDEFRITMYDPAALRRTHGRRRHMYLIARPLLEADVVINLPKLKSHKKAGMTAALKNLVGINGNKEFLPHHRKGHPSRGGDCYAVDSFSKRLSENILDFANHQNHPRLQHVLTRITQSILRRLGDADLEGSWYGNDTVWRMCLDLNRILLYGDTKGNLSSKPQRTVMHITDAIIGGEGDGPLAPTSVESGFVTGAMNAAAADWVNAYLMGFDPQTIPLCANAFGVFAYPIARFLAGEVRVRYNGELHSVQDVRHCFDRVFRPPAGWSGHCELK